ncbi:MAG: NADH-quinone oxidoreductase subunit N [Deltaproteobacteria bacterium]|nr:NADH-quinone oxidoreductase subunit N [Deltaproteobacteria bacterium]
MLGNGASLAYVIPEGILGVTVALVMALGSFKPTRTRGVLAAAGIAGMAAALAATAAGVSWPDGTVLAFHGNIVSDGMVAVFRLVFLLTGLLTIVFAYGSDEVDTRDFGDMTAMIAASVMGMCFMAAAADLLMMYLAMEFVGILSYVLAGLKREDQRSSEAALKYVIFGAASSGVALFGMSLLYGIAGDTSLAAVRAVLVGHGFEPLGLMALVMILAGLGYKMAAVPFHMWCPDVYQGAPTPITAFFSVAPKAAGFALTLRLMDLLLGGIDGDAGASLGHGLAVLIGLVSMATMTVGNLSALKQTSVKRLLAYSSIAHAGYLLMGVATIPAIMGPSPDYTGFRAVFFYLVIYLFMNLGAFLVVTRVVTRLGSDDVSAFRSLGRRSPLAAVVMAIFLFSLVGLPPTAGFAGKFYLFYAILSQGSAFFYILALVGVANSFISLFYYARIVRVMFLDKSPDTRPVPVGALAAVVLVILAIPTILFGIWFGPLVDLAGWVFI